MALGSDGCAENKPRMGWKARQDWRRRQLSVPPTLPTGYYLHSMVVNMMMLCEVNHAQFVNSVTESDAKNDDVAEWDWQQCQLLEPLYPVRVMHDGDECEQREREHAQCKVRAGGEQEESVDEN